MSGDADHVVVVIDDEEMVIQSIKNFLTLETDYEILAFTSPIEALDVLRERQVDLIISDYLMPELNGIDFFLKIKEIQPQATRVLLTGYADKENAIRAINEVQLYWYLEKPWDNDALLLLVRNGLMHGKLLKQVAAKTKDLERVQTEILKAFV